MNFFNAVYKLKNYIKHISFCAIGVFLILTYIIINFSEKSVGSAVVLALIYIDIALLFVLCLFLLRKIRGVFRLNLSQRNNRRFHNQVITLFSCVTIIPSILVFGFSVLFFNIGIENLFKAPIKNVIDNAETVSNIYINDIKLNLENFTIGMGGQVIDLMEKGVLDGNSISKLLEDETSSTKIDAMVIQIIDQESIRHIATTPFSLSLKFENLPQDLPLIGNGEALSFESNDRVISVVALEKARGIYLVASAPIEETIMDHKYKIHTAVMEYSNLATQRGSVKISFILFFTVVTTILLLSSILVGGIFANRILKPINKLISATKSVTSGNYDVLIKSEKYNSEFDILISTFNNMMSKLEQQKQQLIISNRQSAWRDIARKIAHEIKNPLTPIQLSAERLRNKYKDEIVNKPEVFNSCIDTIVRQVQCIGNLVKEFSDFARMPVPKMEKVDIVSVIKEAIVLQSNAHRYIRFHQFFDKESYICEIDQTQINQVLINVIQNAANAIVESRDIKSGNISVRFFVEGNMMNISIEDDGPGFSESAKEKAFDPYYTTREKGTGLGLAIVQKIVLDHFGEISIDKSQVFGGARILIRIPNNLTMKEGKTYGI